MLSVKLADSCPLVAVTFPMPHGERERYSKWWFSAQNLQMSSWEIVKSLLEFRQACVVSHLSRIWLFTTLWTGAHQVPLSMEFPRQGYWSELPCLPPRDLTHPGIEPPSVMSPALSGRFFTTSAKWEDFKQAWFLLNENIKVIWDSEYSEW